MRQDQHQGPRRDSRQDSRQRSGRKTSVLVVENNPTIRGMLHMMLDLEGYPVRAVAGAAEALRELDAMREPRVVLLNESLPDVDGAQVLSAAASHPKLRRHRYVLMSTCSSCEARHSASPHAGLLLKPFSVEELLDVVEDAASDLPPVSQSRSLAQRKSDSSPTPSSAPDSLSERRSDVRPGLSPSLFATLTALTTAVYAAAGICISVARHARRGR
jgi:CheY-like chemotaxis protein